MDLLKGKNIVITGASSGIGKALSIEASKCGANLVLASRQIDQLEAIKSEISNPVSTLFCIQTDVTSQKECENLIHLAKQKLGSIDVLINNARKCYIETCITIVWIITKYTNVSTCIT